MVDFVQESGRARGAGRAVIPVVQGQVLQQQEEAEVEVEVAAELGYRVENCFIPDQN